LPHFSGSNPAKIIKEFRQYIANLLNSTVTDAPVSEAILEKSPIQWRARISLGGKTGEPRAIPLKPAPWHLALSQHIAAVRDRKRNWSLRTLQYSYRIQGGPDLRSDWYFRFEYKSREVLSALHPRSHLHLPVSLDCGTRRMDLSRVHIPTGQVTLEEIIRFLIQELGVKAKVKDWDSALRISEEEFWTWASSSDARP